MKTHRTDLVSLIPGLAFVGIAIAALTDTLDLDLFTADWIWPALLVALGLVVLASAGRSPGHAAGTQPPEAGTQPPEAGTQPPEAEAGTGEPDPAPNEPEDTA